MYECDNPKARLTQQQAHRQQQRADGRSRQFGWRCRLFGCPLTAVVCVHAGAHSHRKHLVGLAGVTLSIRHLHLQLIHTRPQIVAGVESSGCLWTQQRRWTNSIFDLTESFRFMLSYDRQGRKCQKCKVMIIYWWNLPQEPTVLADWHFSLSFAWVLVWINCSTKR